MTDGRVVDEQGEPTQEDFQKYKIISPNQFIGFAGNKEYCEFIAKEINYVDTNYDLNSISKEAFEYSNENAKHLKWNFVLAGIDVDGLISAYYFNHTSNMVDYFKPKGEEINYLFLHNTENKLENKVDEAFTRILEQRKSNSVFEFYDAQKRFNEYVASIDTAVNTATFKHRVRK